MNIYKVNFIIIKENVFIMDALKFKMNTILKW